MLNCAMVYPIFLGGDARSGTTLLAMMLDSHPLLTFGTNVDFLDPENLGSHILECCDLLAAGDARVAGPGVSTRDPEWQLGVQFVRHCHRFGVELADLRRIIERTMRSHGTNLMSFEGRCTLIDCLGEFRRGTAGWGMKVQQQITWAPKFAAFWPQARFIHIVRDGRDVAASHLRGNRGWGYTSIEEAARGWVEIVDCAARRNPATHVLKYESLVCNPRAELASLLEFLELQWDDALLHHSEIGHALAENPYLHPSAEAAARPVNREAVGRFIRDLSPGEIAAFEQIAGETLRRFNYPLYTRAVGRHAG